MKSFLFIWIFTSVIPTTLLYLIYTRFTVRSIYLNYTFLAVTILITILLYYFIRVRQARIFIETGIDKEYYDFGRYNGILKPAAIVLIFGLIVLLGRAAMIYFEKA